MNKKAYDVFMVLGAVWLIIGFIIYKNASLWPIGVIFLLVGLIGRVSKPKDRSKDDSES